MYLIFLDIKIVLRLSFLYFQDEQIYNYLIIFIGTKRLYFFFRQKFLCDLSIKCGNKIMFVHKIILASNSEYFNKMFTGIFMESHIKEVTMNEMISPDAVELLIDYMYTSNLKITEYNVQVKCDNV